MLTQVFAIDVSAYAIMSNHTYGLFVDETTAKSWTTSEDFRKLIHAAVGHSDVLTDYCEQNGLKRSTDVNCCDKLLS